MTPELFPITPILSIIPILLIDYFSPLLHTIRSQSAPARDRHNDLRAGDAIAVGHGLVATAGAVHVGRIVCVTRMALGATIGIRP